MAIDYSSEITSWDERISSVIADPNSSLESKDFENPDLLLGKTATVYELRKPRKDGKVGKVVTEIVKQYVKEMR